MRKRENERNEKKRKETREKQNKLKPGIGFGPNLNILLVRKKDMMYDNKITYAG